MTSIKETVDLYLTETLETQFCNVLNSLNLDLESSLRLAVWS